MGSGSRFKVYFHSGFGLGIHFGNFPFACTISVQLFWMNVTVGFGRAYDS
jgi:hypothetical protein